MSEIVKVQIPLFSSAAPANALPLVYDEGRRHMVQQPLDQATKLAMGDDVKAFFQAEYDPSADRWSIGARVKDRDW